MTTTVGRLLVGMVVGGSMLWSAGVVVAQGGEVCFQRFKNSNVGTEFYFSFPPCFEDEAVGGQNNVVI
ncbi:MAG: hypothetical protein NZ473_07325, partial [Candidatus Kapabacteria bacterium]|nr:hypothetical protein [Candidatus Kapabacteria bacterium]